MPALAAVDLGAQSGRVARGDFDGERLFVTEVHRFENTPVQAGGVLQWDILRLYAEVLDGLRAAARDATIDSVAVDSWAVDFGLVDGAGRLVRGPVHYRDTRRADAVDYVYSRIPPRELYERTGIQLLPINTVFELAAMTLEDDPALVDADTLLLVPDLLHLWLCGSRTTELTNATTTQCFDPRARSWAGDLLERLNVPTRLLPEVVEPGTDLGPLDAASSDLPELDGTRVVAVATHDTGSAVAALPLEGPDSVYLSVGTWSLVGVELDQPLITDETFAANLTNEGGVAGTTRLLKNVTGLWLVHECRRSWGETYTFEELIELAADAPELESLVDPDEPAFATPGDMPARVGAYCAETAQPVPGSPGATVRTILESLALRHAEVVDLLARVTGRAPRHLHVVGGGARNALLCQWTADAAGCPVLAGPAEATLVGNLLVQAIALGELASVDEARDVVRRSFDPVVYEPTESARVRWAEARERFARLTRASGVAA